MQSYDEAPPIRSDIIHIEGLKRVSGTDYQTKKEKRGKKKIKEKRISGASKGVEIGRASCRERV